jgi:hypothetical protein
MSHLIDCSRHGKVGFAMACIHICRAIDGGQQVGFYWGEQGERFTRPHAWCAACEEYLVKNENVTLQELKVVMDSQVLCEQCWDEARSKLYHGKS